MPKLLIVFLIVLASMGGCTPEPDPFPSEIGEKIEFGRHSWIVLDLKDESALIITEHVIDRRPFSLSNNDSTWENSCIRYWLNNDFYNIFDYSDRNRIMPSEIVNDDNEIFGSNAGPDTVDKIFLLSAEEALQYFGGGERGDIFDSSGNVIGIWDEMSYTRIAYDVDGEVRPWRLRSPGQHNNYNANISISGSINLEGGYSDSPWGGIRPALWISLAP